MKKWLFFVVCSLILIWAYFQFSPSYSLSRKAKEEFAKGNYQESYHLANLALEKNLYNKAAFSVVNQSKQRLNIQNFLNKTKENYKILIQILQKPKLSPQEFLQIQWIYEAFIREYQTLFFFNHPTKQEKEEIESYAQWFKQLKLKIDSAKEIKH